MNIIVGMSGGVDSSVAALVLKNAGHAVSGVTMAIWDGEENFEVKKHACYGPDEKEDIAEARDVCRQLDIEHHLFDCAKEYRETVVAYFREEYISGRTPNPCVMCNNKVKFGVLIDAASAKGLAFDKFATGHYARVDFDETTGKYLLKKGRDPKKDQSYFIHRLTQEQLAKVIFPLGDMMKAEVRALSRQYSLSVTEKAESQDFYSGDYRDLIGDVESSGDVVNTDGKILGKHSGLWNYTPGQRRGIGVSGDKPLYVVKLDSAANRVVVGEKSKVMRAEFHVENMTWISGSLPSGIFSAAVKVRHMQGEIDCTVEMSGENSGRVLLAAASEHIAPGQSAVFYHDDIVLGGGMIV